jgi:hypothetical protein
MQVDDDVFDDFRAAQVRELEEDAGEMRDAERRGREIEEEVDRSLGRAVIVTDAEGVPFGLVELTEHTERHYNFGRQHRELRAAQVRIHRRAVELGRRVRERHG